MAQQNCLECGEKIQGRIDKKFCGDYCRNAWHNKKNVENRAEIRKVNSTLLKNRNLLKDLYEKRSLKLVPGQLMELGLNFAYFTHLRTGKKQETIRYCYEYGYCVVDDEKVVIFRDNMSGAN